MRRDEHLTPPPADRGRGATGAVLCRAAVFAGALEEANRRTDGVDQRQLQTIGGACHDQC